MLEEEKHEPRAVELTQKGLQVLDAPVMVFNSISIDEERAGNSTCAVQSISGKSYLIIQKECGCQYLVPLRLVLKPVVTLLVTGEMLVALQETSDD